MQNWFKYLNTTTEIKYNVANVSSMAEMDATRVAKYVERCLEIAKADLMIVDSKYHKLILRTLQWMDVAKCGSEEDRLLWKTQCPNICLDIHNEASAEIYRHNSDEGDDEWTKNIVYHLIKTHGLVGQYIMGETRLSSHAVLQTLGLEKDALFKILKILNHAVIAGVSEDLWKRVNVRINMLLVQIVNGIYKDDDTLTRLKKLFPAFNNIERLTEDEELLYQNIFNNVNLWYPTIALQNFSRQELNTIFKMLSSYDFSNIKHISFYDISKELSYDRNGVRKENVYKKRIIEVLLREMSENNLKICKNEHVCISCEVDSDCLRFKVTFTPACIALINFCIEAERSGLMTYQKNIITIFDIFGFRRDVFDRLSNEEQYLETMNNAQNSTKLSILDYVQGDTVVDVGSGGGVLLDLLEKNFPDKQIVGTDISANVIEALENKVNKEHHNYQIWQHNFVHNALWSPVDTIIFSSIIHEIFSYTEYDGLKFNLASVKQALNNATWSLNHGGRIVIRDGVKTASNEIVSIRIKDEDTLVLAKNFLRDFKGLPELRDENGWQTLIVNGNQITANINLIREMLYTITWGAMSYAQEVQEQFGYLTLNDYVDLLKSLGLNIVEAREFTECGYPQHLNNKVELLDFTWDDIPSNCIIVAEK